MSRGPVPELAALLAEVSGGPADVGRWLAIGDLLERRGEPGRAELVRLACRLRTRREDGGRPTLEARVRELLAGGVLPCIPELANSVGMRMALVPAGSFYMGSAEGEEGRDGREGPRHQVSITRPFWMGMHAVTQGQYEAVTGANPSRFRPGGGGGAVVRGLDTRDFPVECVSWDEASGFCRVLSGTGEESEAGRAYRLPTEAEWEYACRAGLSSGAFNVGAALGPLQAHFRGPQRAGPYPAGGQAPNAWGLYDMHGNVWEWCADWYAEDFYTHSPAADPVGPPGGTDRVARGGCWESAPGSCRSAGRSRVAPGERFDELGFRVVLALGGREAAGVR